MSRFELRLKLEPRFVYFATLAQMTSETFYATPVDIDDYCMLPLELWLNDL